MATEVRVDDSLIDYLLKIVAQTRENDALELGISPRGTLALFRSAQALALIDGRDFCIADDIKRLVLPVFAHRVIVNSRQSASPNAEVLKPNRFCRKFYRKQRSHLIHTNIINFMEFEWDERKAKENIKKHDGISFEEAAFAFYDKWAIEEYDDSHSDFEEQRIVLIGLATNLLLRVTYTVRKNEIIRIISAEKARPFEERAYNKNRNEYDK